MEKQVLENQRIRYYHSRKTWKFSSGVLFFALLAVLPVIWLFVSWFEVDADLWQHLLETQLAELIWNSVRLAIGVFYWRYFIRCRPCLARGNV